MEYINSEIAIAGWINEDDDLVMLKPGDNHYKEALAEYRTLVEKEIAALSKL